MESYVNAMVIKTHPRENYLVDLQETIENRNKHGVKLNPTKCIFGVPHGHFLGFIVIEWGIEANSKKIRIIRNLQEPRSLKDIQWLNRCIAALRRFISKSVKRCFPFFKALKVANKEFNWVKKNLDFAELKNHLGSLPILSRPKINESLYLYLAVADLELAAMLIREKDNRKEPIYYVSNFSKGQRAAITKLWN